MFTVFLLTIGNFAIFPLLFHVLGDSSLKTFTNRNTLFVGEKTARLLGSSCFLQFTVQILYDSAFDVALMRTKAPRETSRNMQKLVDERFLFLYIGHFIVNLRDNLNSVGWWDVEHFLPQLA